MTHTVKHTPGPWVISAGRVITTNSGQFYVTYGADKYGNPLFKNFVELDNNATLIAAAPAMFDALQNILKFYEWSDSNGAEQAAYDKAIKALAQALGKQS